MLANQLQRDFHLRRSTIAYARPAMDTPNDQKPRAAFWADLMRITTSALFLATVCGLFSFAAVSAFKIDILSKVSTEVERIVDTVEHRAVNHTL